MAFLELFLKEHRSIIYTYSITLVLLMKHRFYREHSQIFAEAKAFLSSFLPYAIYKAESSRERSNPRPVNDWRNIYLFNAHNKY